MLRQSECCRVLAYVQEFTNNQCQSKRGSGLVNDAHRHEEGVRLLAETPSVRVNKRLTGWLSITRMSGLITSERPESGEGMRALDWDRINATALSRRMKCKVMPRFWIVISFEFVAVYLGSTNRSPVRLRCVEAWKLSLLQSHNNYNPAPQHPSRTIICAGLLVNNKSACCYRD